MKKALLIIILVFFSAVYIISSVLPFTRWLGAPRMETTAWWGSDQDMYGDMYGISYLHQFKYADKLLAPVPNNTESKKRDIHLYIMCDSYLHAFIKTGSIFYGVDSVTITRFLIKDDLKIKLDLKKKNILLIEATERLARGLDDTSYMLNKLIVVTDKENQLLKIAPKPSFIRKTIFSVIQTYMMAKFMIFSPLLMYTLEFNLDRYVFLTPLKELKAKFNYEVFGRVNNDITISPNGKHLFYSLSTDTSSTSSFVPIPDKDINHEVASLNKVYDHYKAKGFDGVYLSIIPNPVTILAPQLGKYNNLITRIQNNPALKMPYIDIYSKFKKVDPSIEIYQFSDSHWNNVGFKMWVDEFNKVLKEEDKKLDKK